MLVEASPLIEIQIINIETMKHTWKLYKIDKSTTNKSKKQKQPNQTDLCTPS